MPKRWPGRRKSGSRRRAGAALWRAAKAEGPPHSKTLRDYLRGSRIEIGIQSVEHLKLAFRG